MNESNITNTMTNTPWIEKFRPTTLDEVVGQDNIVKMLKNITNMLSHTDGCGVPHMLMTGKTGVGKTSTIQSFANDLFGTKTKERILELNASHDRGINVVRTKIQNFAKMKIGTPDPNKPCPPLKLIILDEADAMTRDAQCALRAMIETSSNNTRFCFICNYEAQILDAIRSRCAKISFTSIHRDVMMARLTDICNSENIKCIDELNMIVDTSRGDMRNALTMLYNIKMSTTTVNVLKYTGFIVPDEIISSIVSLSNTLDAIKLSKLVKRLNISSIHLLDSLTDKILNIPKLINLLPHIAKAQCNLCNGCSDYLQITHIFCLIALIHREDV